MPKQHTVTESDCIESISFENGLLPATVWNHADNEALRKKRENQNILMAGDVVVVPDVRVKTESVATDEVHRFVRKGVPAKITFKVLKLGKPIANADYELDIEGKVEKGKTDGDGIIKIGISPGARKGTLKVFDEDEDLVYPLRLGHMDPWNEVSGYQKRLENLGYPVAPDAHGTLGDGTHRALAQFQADHDLSESGKPDNATLAKVKEIHGS